MVRYITKDIEVSSDDDYDSEEDSEYFLFVFLFYWFVDWTSSYYKTHKRDVSRLMQEILANLFFMALFSLYFCCVCFLFMLHVLGGYSCGLCQWTSMLMWLGRGLECSFFNRKRGLLRVLIIGCQQGKMGARIKFLCQKIVFLCVLIMSFVKCKMDQVWDTLWYCDVIYCLHFEGVSMVQVSPYYIEKLICQGGVNPFYLSCI